MPMIKDLEAERILDTRVENRTRRKEYMEYLVKWKDRLMEDSTWMSVATQNKANFSIEDLMSRSS